MAGVGGLHELSGGGDRRGCGPVASQDVEKEGAFGPGCLFVTVTKAPPRVINEKGDVDPTEVNVPAKITLRVSGADGGFLGIQPQVGIPPLLAGEAPAVGISYTPTLEIYCSDCWRCARRSVCRCWSAGVFFLQVERAFWEGEYCVDGAGDEGSEDRGAAAVFVSAAG